MREINIMRDEDIPPVLDWALAGNKSLAISGNNSKVRLGRSMECDAQLSMAGITGVLLHEPAELVMRARAGTKLTDIEATLSDAGQELAFAPPDLGPLLGQDAGQATIGGIFSCNLSGSKRIKAGAARDHLLGVTGYSGRGQPFKAGGRVMKNVTGYDLCKLVAGSYGTLALCTSFTFKVLPRPEKTRTILIFGLSVADAVNAMRDALSSIHEVSSVAYLPADIASNTGIDYIDKAGLSVVAIRVDGPGPSAEYRCNALREEMNTLGTIEELHGHNSVALWSFVSDVKPFVVDQSATVWKVSVPPASAPAYLERLLNDQPDIRYYLDWAGGLIWLSVPAGKDKGAEPDIRRHLNEGGHATLIRGSEELRRIVSPFQPQNAVLAGISEKVRNGFDPQRIFNPGRMVQV